MSNAPIVPSPATPPQSNHYGSFWNAFTFDVTQEEDEQNRFRFNPQVQDGWRSYNLYSLRTDKHREFMYWLRQSLAINPSIIGFMQLPGMFFYGALPRYLITALYTTLGLSTWTILVGLLFLVTYASIALVGLKTRELTVPTAVRIILGLAGAILL